MRYIISKILYLTIFGLNDAYISHHSESVFPSLQDFVIKESSRGRSRPTLIVTGPSSSDFNEFVDFMKNDKKWTAASGGGVCSFVREVSCPPNDEINFVHHAHFFILPTPIAFYQL